MNERDSWDGERGGARDCAGHTLAGDLEALRALTSRDLPSLASTLTSTNCARGDASQALPGGSFMNALHKARTRPWLATALGTAAVALALLFIPVSYDRLIGSELTLRLPGEEVAPGVIREIASDLRTRLNAERVRVEAAAGGSTTLIAEIPDASWRRVGRLAVDYARGLAERGIQATPRVRPRFEKVHGSVYAAIGNLVDIRIQTGGKTDQEIAAEIRGQLLAAGLTDASVEVNRQDGRTQIRIEATSTATGDDSSPGSGGREFRVTLDDQNPAASDPQIEESKVRVQRTEGMTDQQVIDEVQRQLREQGVNDAEVTVDSNGKVQVRRPGK